MDKKTTKRYIPVDILKRANHISQTADLSKIDGFRALNGIIPEQILEIKKIRKPKSKDTFLQIDTRRILKL